MRSTLPSGKRKGSSSPRDGVLSAVENIFNEIAMHAKAQASNRLAKATRASHGPRVRAKEKVKRTRENPKESPKEPKGAIQGVKGSHKGKTSKTGLSGLENSKSETSPETQESAKTCPTDNSWFHDGWCLDAWNDGWSYDEWNDDWSLVGWHEGWEQTCDTSASSLSLGGLDVSATRNPKRFEWVKMKLDTGAAVNTFPLNFGPDGTGGGRFYRTASGVTGFLMVELGSSKDSVKMVCSDL